MNATIMAAIQNVKDSTMGGLSAQGTREDPSWWASPMMVVT